MISLRNGIVVISLKQRKILTILKYINIILSLTFENLFLIQTNNYNLHNGQPMYVPTHIF